MESTDVVRCSSTIHDVCGSNLLCVFFSWLFLDFFKFKLNTYIIFDAWWPKKFGKLEKAKRNYTFSYEINDDVCFASGFLGGWSWFCWSLKRRVRRLLVGFHLKFISAAIELADQLTNVWECWQNFVLTWYPVLMCACQRCQRTWRWTAIVIE